MATTSPLAAQALVLLSSLVLSATSKSCGASSGQALLQVQQSLRSSGTFESARPDSCCPRVSTVILTWSEFEQHGDFAENISKGLPLVVPCGFEVIVDQNLSLRLPGIQVEGSVKFKDGVDIMMQTAFVFVCGKFSIGSPGSPHRSKVDIILSSSAEVKWPQPDGPPMSFGTAGFITYGGETYIRGSACETPAWTRLAKTVAPPFGSQPNLALGKPASQSSVGHHRYTAEKAVDGKVHWKFSSILTRRELNPWWYVKIPSSPNLGVVAVTGRGHRGIDLSAAIVGVTDLPCQPGLLCGGTICKHATTRAGKLDFDCGGASGEYLYIQLNGSTILTLSEVEIFSATSTQHELELQGTLHADWEVGDQLMITSTSMDAEQSEQVTVVGKTAKGVMVSGPLVYEHLGCSITSDQCIMAAEVASLSRNIVIRGEDGCQPLCGHFMIAHTNHGFVCGAEFTNLGQTAVEGRYPLHVHLPGEAPELVLKGNALHHNINRGMVMHGVHNMTAESNLCFRTKGHCFMTEDGVEQYNIFRKNIGVLPSGLNFGCSQTHDKTFLCPHRSDNAPNPFWISNPNNFFIGNIGIGKGVAFQFETRHVMGLVRRKFPQEAFKVGSRGKIKGSTPLAEFSGNMAHSSQQGVNNYPRMAFRRGGRNRYENFTAWRCSVGMSAHNSPTTSLPMVGALLVENTFGVRAGLSASRIQIIESKITAAPSSMSVPLIINKLGKTKSMQLETVFSIDNYTRNWVRCYGGYTRGRFFSPFDNPHYEHTCPNALLSSTASREVPYGSSEQLDKEESDEESNAERFGEDEDEDGDEDTEE